MAKTGLYKGISFVRYKDRKTLSLSDVELVKQDLLNHIYTRWGERIKMGKFGTRITDMGFEQLDEITMSIIENDIINVINYDPRVIFATDGILVDGLQMIPLYDEGVLLVSAELYYVELDLRERLDLRLEFNE